METTSNIIIDPFQKYTSTIEILGYTIKYWKVGNGPNIIFGFPGQLGPARFRFSTLLQRFSKEMDKYTFYTMDRPGYFGSQPPSRKLSDINFQVDVDICAEFLKLMGHQQYSLLGYSAGAQVVMLLTMKHPELVKSLVVWGAWDLFYNENLEAHNEHKDLKLRDQTYIKYLIREDGSSWEHLETQLHAWMDYILKEYYNQDEALWVKRFEKITCPTFIIVGTEDKFGTVAQGNHLNKHIKNSRLHIISGAPHRLQLYKPDEFFDLITTFILQ